MVKKSLFILLTSRFTTAEKYCESSDECLDGGICNFDFDYGGFCETCPGNTEQSCYDTGFHNDKGTDECKSICIPQGEQKMRFTCSWKGLEISRSSKVLYLKEISNITGFFSTMSDFIS